MSGAQTYKLIYDSRYERSDVPPEYGAAKTLYSRCKRSAEAGISAEIFNALAAENADPRFLMIDASHIKTHRIAANGIKKHGRGRSIGRTKGGLNSKLHLVCDGAGNLSHIALSSGNEADITHAKQCLRGLIAKGVTLIADRG